MAFNSGPQPDSGMAWFTIGLLAAATLGIFTIYYQCLHWSEATPRGWIGLFWS